MKFSKVYPLYVQKAERKERTKAEVDKIICWLTGYDEAGLQRQIDQEIDFKTFFAQAPAMHPNRALIKGVVCGVRIEEIEDPLMQKIDAANSNFWAAKNAAEGGGKLGLMERQRLKLWLGHAFAGIAAAGV